MFPVSTLSAKLLEDEGMHGSRRGQCPCTGSNSLTIIMTKPQGCCITVSNSIVK